MTYRYYKIRREIFEDDSEKPLKKLRSGSELKELYKPFHWIVFGLMIGSLIAIIVISIFVTNKLWNTVPLLIIILLTDLWDYKAEKFYNKDARKKELISIDCDYENYLKSIYEILQNNGIESEKELNILIDECSKVLEKRDNCIGNRNYIYVRSNHLQRLHVRHGNRFVLLPKQILFT